MGYKEQLEKDNVTKVINEGHNIREYSVVGIYRYLLARPGDLDWNILHYKQPTDDLSYTDLDALQNNPKPMNDGDLKALQLAFTLPSSTYATMLLREIMRTTTRASFHRNKEL